MTAPPTEFRDVLRHFPSGVTIVTIKAGDAVHGLTVSAFASISPTPPLIMVAIDHKHYAHELLQQADAVFAVNILGADQESLSNRFAWTDEDRFGAGRWETAATGAPVLADALAWLECRIYSHHEAGTHTIYVGQVLGCAVNRADETPLVYWNRAYRRLAQD